MWQSSARIPTTGSESGHYLNHQSTQTLPHQHAALLGTLEQWQEHDVRTCCWELGLVYE